VCHHLLERSTPARLAAAAALGRGRHDLEALGRAQALLLDLIVEQQVADVQAGLPPSNKVAVRRLTREQRKALRDALSSVRHLGALTRDLLF
jgi:DNA polymerase-3 subunit epsilon/CBS domain-containing protein